MMLSPIEAQTSEITGLGASMTPETLASWQMGRVRDTLRRVMRESRFYAKRLTSVDIESIRTPNDMSKLPFTTPADVASSPLDFLCVPSADVARIRTLMTSGSTAAPKRIFFTSGDTARTVRFFSRGMTTFTRPGDHVMIAMSDDRPDSIAALLRKGTEMMGATADIHGAVTDIDAAMRDARRAQIIVGLPSEIRCLCTSCPSLRPKAVLLSADYVPDAITASIRNTWCCEVYSHYGMTETCYGCAVQCKAFESHHIRHEEDLIEIIDPVSGRRLPAGETGEIVVTVFAAEAMPLIRYRTGDVSSLTSRPCGCGGVLPRLNKVCGRYSGLMRVGGCPLSIGELDEMVYGVPQIRIYRAELDGEKLEIFADSNGQFDASVLRARLGAVLPDIEIIISRETLDLAEMKGKRRIEIKY